MIGSPLSLWGSSLMYEPSVQLKPGTGWVLEPYRGDNSRTLISFLAHVSITKTHSERLCIVQYYTTFSSLFALQLDLIDIPPVLANMVLRVYPLQIHYLRKHLMKRGPSPRRPLGSLHLRPTHLLSSGAHYEDPLPVRPVTDQPSHRRSHSLTNLGKLTLPFGEEEEESNNECEQTSSHGVCEGASRPRRGSLKSEDHVMLTSSRTMEEVVGEVARLPVPVQRDVEESSPSSSATLVSSLHV